MTTLPRSRPRATISIQMELVGLEGPPTSIVAVFGSVGVVSVVPLTVWLNEVVVVVDGEVVVVVVVVEGDVVVVVVVDEDEVVVVVDEDELSLVVVVVVDELSLVVVDEDELDVVVVVVPSQPWLSVS
jgi:hypothetical protein